MKATVSATETLNVFPTSIEGMENYLFIVDFLGGEDEYEYQVEPIPSRYNNHMFAPDVKQSLL